MHPADVACQYVDRRGRHCSTVWCNHHAVEVEGTICCARHASTLIAVGPDGIARGALPELENRAPSLVYWVGRDLDADVTQILTAVVRHADGESVVVDKIALITGGGRHGERRWDRTWKVISHTGISHRVSLQVREGAPREILLRVDQNMVDHEVPPWIEAQSGGSTSAEGAASARRAFYRRLHNAIAAGIQTHDLSG